MGTLEDSTGWNRQKEAIAELVWQVVMAGGLSGHAYSRSSTTSPKKLMGQLMGYQEPPGPYTGTGSPPWARLGC